MAYVVTAKWTAKEGEEGAVLEAMSRLAEPSRAEPGCSLYRPNRDPENPRVFFIYEEYADASAYEAHGASEHFRRHGLEDAIPRLEARERAFYETLDV
ncbi:MAG: antibiotic biosynthesis monooxygenase [Actinobacteria bacterium]|nr:antibiotic biosynthesis monooxygenase [Actinomycetota bacterium]